MSHLRIITFNSYQYIHIICTIIIKWRVIHNLKFGHYFYKIMINI